jgi:chromosome segregation ATPase
VVAVEGAGLRRRDDGFDVRRWPVTRSLAVLLLLLASAGCASWPIVGPALLLARADRQAREGAWREAVASYDEYLARFSDDSDAPRVLDSRDTLAAMLTARAELTRRRQEVVGLRDELTTLLDEGTQLREGRTRLRAEATVLRDEVIRLREEKMQLREEKTLLQEERTQLHEELTRRASDLARTRQELAARRAEAERLRADIERLKQIDMQLERKR